jgi:GTP-binding protein
MAQSLPEFEFILSAARLSQAPADQGLEVAFAGRSNAGKSSALNAISGRRKLARTSRTPGRTQLLNFFTVAGSEQTRLVDLPGYGFAKVPERVKQQWDALLSAYLERRESLQGLFLIMDIRHPLKPFDVQMLSWCHQAHLAVHILLTKADKLSRNKANATMLQVRQQLKSINPEATVQLFSATKQQGIDEARQLLLGWLGLTGTKKSPGTEGG